MMYILVECLSKVLSYAIFSIILTSLVRDIHVFDLELTRIASDAILPNNGKLKMTDGVMI